MEGAAPAIELLLSIMTLIVIVWVLAKLTQMQKIDTSKYHRGWLKKR